MKHTPATALVTGFEPFDGEPVNPSREIARALDGELIAGHRIVGAVLPTGFARALPVLDTLIDARRPALVLALGLAGGRSGISLERVAINLIDARIADNAGEQPVDVPVVENAANAYFSTLPLKAMLARLAAAGIPATLSHTAGTFVCNQVFFGLADRIAMRDRQLRGGFIHVPWLPEQAARHGDAPGMPLATMIDAIRLCLETALTAHTDLRYASGTEH
ncbi:MAG: pyroglutamyl-peptidase I [Rudaea sp.]|nr:pyroglutamyl-peptidase I [Rudaea sp.]